MWYLLPLLCLLLCVDAVVSQKSVLTYDVAKMVSGSWQLFKTKVEVKLKIGMVELDMTSGGEPLLRAVDTSQCPLSMGFRTHKNEERTYEWKEMEDNDGVFLPNIVNLQNRSSFLLGIYDCIIEKKEIKVLCLPGWSSLEFVQGEVRFQIEITHVVAVNMPVLPMPVEGMDFKVSAEAESRLEYHVYKKMAGKWRLAETGESINLTTGIFRLDMTSEGNLIIRAVAATQCRLLMGFKTHKNEEEKYEEQYEWEENKDVVDGFRPYIADRQNQSSFRVGIYDCILKKEEIKVASSDYTAWLELVHENVEVKINIVRVVAMRRRRERKPEMSATRGLKMNMPVESTTYTGNTSKRNYYNENEMTVKIHC